MVPNLDDLIEWLLDEIVSSGEDGISLSQFLVFIDAFHKDANKQITETPGAGASPTGERTSLIDHDFKKVVWKAFTNHPDVLIGEDKRGNGLDLTEIEALPLPTAEASCPGNPPSEPFELSPSGYENQAFSGKDPESCSSPSAQLLGQLQFLAAQTPPIHGQSTTSIQGDAGASSLVTFQQQPPSSEIVSDTNGATAKEPANSSSTQPNHGPQIDKMVYMTTCHDENLSEATEPIHKESGGHEMLSLTPQNLITQPRIYVSRERIPRTTTHDNSTSNGKDPGFEPHTNLPKSRGRPPGKTNDPPRRRGRPPKAKASTPMLTDSPTLPMPQKNLTTEFPGETSPTTLESTPEPNKRPRRQTQKVLAITEPKTHRGKGATKVATFTSDDECRRAAGIPGVYFDIAELEMAGIGRPKKRKIALFKSEKLKSLSWMKGVAQDVETDSIMSQPVSRVEFAVPGDSMKNSVLGKGTNTRKRSRDFELEAPSNESATKKSLIDVARGFGSSRSSPYKSPYLSSAATSYVSPYSTNPPKAITSITQEVTSLDRQSVVSRTVPNHLQSAINKASAIVPRYSSPYAPLQLTNSWPHDHTSSSISSAEQPLSVTASQSTADYQLEAAIKSAGELELPEVTIRLPSSKDGVAGNLYLSLDKKSLIFMTGETQIEAIPVIIQISDISEPPETSGFGSEKTILCITTSSTVGMEEIHQFRFLRTEDAFRAANNMRAKIVTAMMLLDLEDTTETEEPERPFKCSGCDGAWKNMEGLKYHQTKSKTLCNPNYRRKEEKPTLAGQDILGLATAALDVLNEDTTTQSQKHSIPEGSHNDNAMEKPSAQQSMHTAAGIKTKDARSDPELQNGKDIITSLLDENQQVFPGEKSLWFAFVAASLQKSPDSGLPGYDICNTALDLLADTGQIRKVQFSFKDKTGLMKTRTLITKQDVDPTSGVVTAMKQKIKAVFPEYYVPPGFAPPKVVQSMLEERQNRPEVAVGVYAGQKSPQASQSHNLTVEQAAGTVHTLSDDALSNKVTRSGRISRRPQRLQQSAMESSLQNLDGDDSYAEDFSNRDTISRALHFATDSRRKRRRVAAFPEDLHGSYPINMGGANSLRKSNHISSPHTIEDDSNRDTDTDHPQLKRRKNVVRPVEVATDCKALWRPAPAYLQGRNGAWNTPTLPQLTLARKKYAPRTGLPEPITYMQTLNNSAWSFRPYGHGVRPIHARPSKRAEGQTAYLTRIQYGFRPVMMPSGEIFIPSTPPSSTVKNASNAVIEEVSKPAGSTRRKRKYAEQSSNILETQDAVIEGIPLSSDSIKKKRKYARRQTLFSSKTHVETPPPTTVEEQLAALQNPSIISIPSTSLPDDGRRARNFSIWPGHGHFLDVSDQSIPHATPDLGVEPIQSNDRVREGKAWDPDRRAPIAQYMMTARRLTALPADLEGIEESIASQPDLKVEVAFDHQHSIRRRTIEGAISADTEYRLIVAVVVLRTLTGGLDKQIDWVLVSKIFPDLPMNAVSKRWPNLYAKHKQMVDRLDIDFQVFFPEAYERGEVDPIDYDHLVDYDWDGLIDLVLERIDINPGETTTQRLPSSRDILNQTFTIEKASSKKPWRDEYFSLGPPLYRRMEHAASEQSTMPTSQEPPPNLEIDQFTVAKSWARANTLTPSESYDRDFAARKLATIGNGVISAATSALFESKVLMQRNKGRPIPNRGVEITDTFAASLRKHLDETHLTQAVALKTSLDAKFRAGEVVLVEWAAKDGEVLAITNLQAHSRIKLEPIGAPMNKFGLTGGGYQTKKMDKAVLHFELQILPTDSYIYDANIPILAALTPEFWPPRGIVGAIPVWYDIAENLIPAMWKKVVCVVLATVAMRPGTVLKELVRIFTPALEEWEMRILIDWGVRVGALTVLREGYDGWNVAEWWWVVGGWA